MTKRLTKSQISRLTKPGKYPDGNGLYLRVAPGGSKSWILRRTVEGKRRDIGLGGWPVVSLADARAQASGAPVRAKRDSDIPTFATAFEKVYDLHAPSWRPGTRAHWRDSMANFVLPHIGNLPLDAIGREQVLAILTPLAQTKPQTAHAVRTRIRRVLAWGVGHGLIERNMAGEAIDGALPSARHHKVKSHAALHHSDLAEFRRALLSASNIYPCTKIAIQFLMLTAVRVREATESTWDEFDLEAREWRIPAERMKTGVEHRVPLSAPVMGLLDGAKAIRRDGSDLVFPSIRKTSTGPIAGNSFLYVLRGLGYGGRMTMHGLRSTFRDWCAETGQPRELAEAALAHVVGGVEGAYFRSDLFDRRRVLMDEWAAFVVSQDETVIPMVRAQ